MTETPKTNETPNIFSRFYTYIAESRVIKAIGNFFGRIVTKVSNLVNYLTGKSNEKDKSEPGKPIDERTVTTTPASPVNSAGLSKTNEVGQKSPPTTTNPSVSVSPSNQAPLPTHTSLPLISEEEGGTKLEDAHSPANTASSSQDPVAGDTTQKDLDDESLPLAEAKNTTSNQPKKKGCYHSA